MSHSSAAPAGFQEQVPPQQSSVAIGRSLGEAMKKKRWGKLQGDHSRAARPLLQPFCSRKRAAFPITALSHPTPRGCCGGEMTRAVPGLGSYTGLFWEILITRPKDHAFHLWPRVFAVSRLLLQSLQTGVCCGHEETVTKWPNPTQVTSLSRSPSYSRVSGKNIFLLTLSEGSCPSVW